MKKAIFSMLIIMSAIIFGYSQNSVGIIGSINYAGLNHNSFQYDGFMSLKKEMFSSFGVLYKRQIDKKWALSTGVNFTRRGVQSNIDQNIELFDMPIEIGARLIHKMDYVEIPALLEYKLGSDDWKIRPYLFAGPMFAYESGYNIGVKAHLIVNFNLFDYDVDLGNNIFNRFDISGVVGGGLSIPIGKGSVNVDARYIHGFSDILDDPIIDLDITHRNLRLSAAYVYSF